MNLLELHLKTLNLCINIILQLILIINLLKLNLRGLKNNMADVGSVTNFNSSLPNPLATLTSVMGIANTAQQNQLLQTVNQQRQFELHKQQNDAVNGIIGPLATIPNLDSKQAQQIILPQLKSLGLDPATSPIAAQHIGPLLDGTLDDPKKMKLWQAGHTAPFLGTQGFSPTTGPATSAGAQTTALP